MKGELFNTLFDACVDWKIVWALFTYGKALLSGHYIVRALHLGLWEWKAKP